MMSGEKGDSQSLATILLVVIVMILALLVLLLFHLPPLTWQDPAPPAVFQIRAIYHHNEISPFALNYDSRILLVHNGTGEMENDALRAYLFKNGVALNASILTMNGHNFISTPHYGVQWMGGSGCSGMYWSPGETLVIDLKDGTIRPGDRVRVDIAERSTDRIISRHEFAA